MKKLILCISLIILFILTSCGNVKDYEKEKVKDLDFTVVEDEDVPDVVKQKIEEKKMEPFKFSYSDGEYLYIVVGYGEQPTGGYSIQVPQFYLTNEYVVIETELIGPSKDDTVIMSLTYPYVVIKAKDPGLPVSYK